MNKPNLQPFVAPQVVSMKRVPLGTLLIALVLVSMPITAQYDQYGGWSALPVESTGYFYLTEINDRPIWATPDGHAYYPLGINHMSAFEQERYSSIKAFQDKGNAKKKLMADIMYLGMNCGGGGSCPVLLQDQIPFFISINLTKNSHFLPPSKFGFQDVFEQEFMDAMKAKIKSTCTAYRDNRFLMGYYWTDTPRWDVEISRKRHLMDWVSSLRNQNGDAAGKQRYIEFLEKKYVTIEAFNTAYGLNFPSFERMPNARFDHIDFHAPHIIADDTEFLGVIAEHFYKLAAETILEHDPNHLILGEKYIAGDHPEPVLKAAAKYVDVISIQPGPEKGPGPGPGREESVFNAKGFNKLNELTGKPILVCDHTVSFHTDAHPVTLWHQFENKTKAGEALDRYITECANTPYIVGYMHCQYLDAYDADRGLLKQGLINKDGERHEPLCGMLRSTNLKALRIIKSELEKH